MIHIISLGRVNQIFLVLSQILSQSLLLIYFDLFPCERRLGGTSRINGLLG